MRTTGGRAFLAFLLVTLVAVVCGAADYPASVEGARRFLADVEERLLGLYVAAERADWVQATYITQDTEILAAEANEEMIAATLELAQEATRFDGLDLPEDVARQLEKLKLSLTLPAPADAAERRELTRLAAALEGAYGRGKYCRPGGECLTLDEMENILAHSRDAAELLDVWQGWRTVSPPMRPKYERFVELANKGARELGFADLGVMWRAGYDMPSVAFAAELDRLWQQVRPLYEALHCHVRAKLREVYGPEVMPEDGILPAHLLGNMWAQEWGNIYPLVAPPDADPGYELTQRLRAAGLGPVEMVRYAERFFTSLGFEPLPETFWERSLFVKPRDREVVCHASAWNIDWQDDLRIKMCIEVEAEDFATIHHELGHNFYQRAYNRQPLLFRESANDGFHEAVGDTISLSVTPEYLVEIGLLEAEPASGSDLGLLMRAALDKVAFLPFGRLIDEWRWRVFSGEIAPSEYNRSWWELRRKYQGISPPLPRSEEDFDPGAKYHIPAHTPYARYFLAHILQYQFHRALCQLEGHEAPLHRCSLYGHERAGRLFREMLAMGSSRPWPDALETVTGQRQMDATAILDYFAPLKEWLDEENQGRSCGWRSGG